MTNLKCVRRMKKTVQHIRGKINFKNGIDKQQCLSQDPYYLPTHQT